MRSSNPRFSFLSMALRGLLPWSPSFGQIEFPKGMVKALRIVNLDLGPE
jgi:hypothetical protein